MTVFADSGGESSLVRPDQLRAESEILEATLAKPDVPRDWENSYRTAPNEQFYERAFDYLAESLDAAAGTRILDAGCGTGFHAMRLARRGFRVESIDLSDSMLAIARRNIAEANLQDRVSVRRGSILDMPFPDASFEYAICWGVLMHIADAKKAMSELARVVMPGGLLIIEEANMHSLQTVLHRRLLTLAGREGGRFTRSPYGLETWKSTSAGPLLIRQSDTEALIEFFSQAGFTLERRVAAQFTELYRRAPFTPLQKAIHFLNRLWFDRVRLPRPAFTNLILLRKEPNAPSAAALESR